MKKIIFMLCLIWILAGCTTTESWSESNSWAEQITEVSSNPLIQAPETKEAKKEIKQEIQNTWSLISKDEWEENTLIQNISPTIIPQPKKAIDSIFLSLTTLSTHANHLIQVQWENLANIAYITIGWYSYQASIHEWSYYFEVQKNTFTPGEYFISIQDKSGEIIALNQKMTILGWQDHGINLNNITPTTLSNTKKSSIVLQWNGFSKVISVQLDNNIILKEASFDIINDRVMSIEVPKWIPVGSYHFNLLTVEKIVKLPSRALTIQP